MFEEVLDSAAIFEAPWAAVRNYDGHIFSLLYPWYPTGIGVRGAEYIKAMLCYHRMAASVTQLSNTDQ
jgi:hypothetical protein